LFLFSYPFSIFILYLFFLFFGIPDKPWQIILIKKYLN
jgi:hypothetical protein